MQPNLSNGTVEAPTTRGNRIYFHSHLDGPAFAIRANINGGSIAHKDGVIANIEYGINIVSIYSNHSSSMEVVKSCR